LLLVARGGWLLFARVASAIVDVVLPVVAAVVNVFAKWKGCCTAAVAVVTIIVDATDVAVVVMIMED